MGALLVVLAGCAAERPTNAPDSNVSGFHIVDGHWLGPETACPNAKAPIACQVAIAAATRFLGYEAPRAEIARAAVAEPSCSGTTYVGCTGAGLYKGYYVVFDLGDGSRRAVSLICEGFGTDEGGMIADPVGDPQGPDCRPYPLTNQGG